MKKKHGLKGKPGNNPKGAPKGKRKETRPYYRRIPADGFEKLAAKLDAVIEKAK